MRVSASYLLDGKNTITLKTVWKFSTTHIFITSAGALFGENFLVSVSLKQFNLCSKILLKIELSFACFLDEKCHLKH